jgi:hypothetical protein
MKSEQEIRDRLDQANKAIEHGDISMVTHANKYTLTWVLDEVGPKNLFILELQARIKEAEQRIKMYTAELNDLKSLEEKERKKNDKNQRLQ